jgi:hypothetical protein
MDERAKDARLQLHAVAQVVGAFGATHAPRRPDWSHVALRPGAVWSSAAVDGVRVVLRPGERSVGVLSPGGESTLTLPGRTLGAVARWVEEQLGELGLPGRLKVRGPEQRPHNRISRGAPFDIDATSAADWARRYHEAAAALKPLARLDGAAPVLLWPHHFDVSTLRVMSGAGKAARSVTAGYSPGDTSYAEPYWYVTMWPYPRPDELPHLPEPGHWHTEGWTGAVLPASHDAETVRSFLVHASVAGEHVVQCPVRGDCKHRVESLDAQDEAA